MTITEKIEDKYRKSWEKQARYMGGGRYSNTKTGEWGTDLRELFLKYIASMEEHKKSKTTQHESNL
jgi:hypothetical protein